MMMSSKSGAPASRSRRPFGHLAGGLVRERDGEDRVRAHAVLADQIGDAAGEGPGLAGPGPGHDEDRPLRVEDGLPLDGVQAVQERGPRRGLVGDVTVRLGYDA